MKRLLPAPVVLVCTCALALAQAPANPVFQQLVDKGIPIPGGPTVKLPAPLVKPGEVPKDITDLLEKAAGKVPTNLFLKNSVTAPFSVAVESVDNSAGERCAQDVSLSFLAYGKLETVKQGDFIKQLLTGKKKGGKETEVLSAGDLKQRGIQHMQAANVKEEYDQLEMPLLDKVQVEGVTRTVTAAGAHAVVYATLLDDRFKGDKQYPNVWRPIKGEEGKEALGPPTPYSGLGGYVVVTELPEPKGALLVEMHMVLHEPTAWFEGRNLLRSKLPIVIRDNVQSFRRKLASR